MLESGFRFLVGKMFWIRKEEISPYLVLEFRSNLDKSQLRENFRRLLDFELARMAFGASARVVAEVEGIPLFRLKKLNPVSA